jgi:hypothetical protein
MNVQKITYHFSPSDIKQLILKALTEDGYALDGEVLFLTEEESKGVDYPECVFKEVQATAVKVTPKT